MLNIFIININYMNKILQKIVFIFIFSFVFINSAYAFLDVNVDSTSYFREIQFLKEKGVIQGYPDGHFYPNRTINKIEFLKMLIGNVDEDLSYIKIPYNDVEKDAWYTPFVKYGLKIGLLDPQLSYLSPSANLSKLQALVLFFKRYNIPVMDKSIIYQYEDIDILDWNIDMPYADIILSAYLYEILISDYEDRLGVYDVLDRQTAAYMIHWAMTKYGDNYQNLDNILLQGADQKSIDIFNKVIYDINAKFLFWDDVDKKQMINNILKTIVWSLDDPYSDYMTADEYEYFKEILNSNFVGIGIYLGFNEDGEVVILDVIKNSPAEKAGLQSNDIILKVDNIFMSNFTLDEIANMIKGKENTHVDLSIVRNSKILNYQIKREKIVFNVINYDKLDNNIHYMQIQSFSENIYDDFLRYEQYLNQGGNLILDLRNNLGGYVHGTKLILSHFVPKNSVLFSIITRSFNYDTYTIDITSYNVMQFDKIVVLINYHTASSAEIMTLSLKENLDNVVVVGTTTMGKGVGQDLIMYPDGSNLKITSFYWDSPKGININNVGIAPDIIIENITDKDAQFEYAKSLF